MSNRTGCKYCEHSDTNRKNSNGEIRCKRYSRYVKEYDVVCDSYTGGLLALLKEDKEDAEIAEIRKVKQGMHLHLTMAGVING